MLWFRLFILVAKVDLVLLMKRRRWILRWSPTSRINFRLQVSAASWIHLSARWRTSSNCSSRTRLAQLSIALVSLRRTNGPILSGFQPNALSSVKSYAGEIPQSATKAKTIREVKFAFELIWEDLPLEPINKVIKNFTKRLRTCVGTDVEHIEHKL